MRPWASRCVLTLLAVCATALVSAQSTQPAKALSDDEIKALLVAESKAAYAGSCPCPENRTSNGRRCGGNSAYSRPGGSKPLCYPSDVSHAMVNDYRERLAAR